jgi:hypothetical protein
MPSKSFEMTAVRMKVTPEESDEVIMAAVSFGPHSVGRRDMRLEACRFIRTRSILEGSRKWLLPYNQGRVHRLKGGRYDTQALSLRQLVQATYTTRFKELRSIRYFTVGFLVDPDEDNDVEPHFELQLVLEMKTDWWPVPYAW